MLLVEVDEHFRVAVCAEAMSLPLQLGAELPVVVDLAVLDDVDRPVLVGDRLVARLEVDDRQPAGGEGGGAVDEETVAVGPAVDERRTHAGEPLGVGGPVCADDPADPAHAPECSGHPSDGSLSLARYHAAPEPALALTQAV